MSIYGELAKVGIVQTGLGFDFRNGLSVMGAPIVPGLAANGKHFWWDPTNGNDNYSGRSADKAKSTLAAAYALLTAGQHDTLHYIQGSSSGSIAAAFTWAKAYTHFIGEGTHSLNNRCRLFAAAAITTGPMFTVSASGCTFANLSFHYGIASATAKIAFKVTGGRNHFVNCRFAGIGTATQDVAGACSLNLSGAEENIFDNCIIGLDTVLRGSAANSELLVDTGAVRNEFNDCLFVSACEATAHYMVTLEGTSALDRYLIFRNCLFTSFSVNNGFVMASVFLIPSGTQTCRIILDNSTAVDITAWDENSRGRIYIMNAPTPAADTAGIAKND